MFRAIAVLVSAFALLGGAFASAGDDASAWLQARLNEGGESNATGHISWSIGFSTSYFAVDPAIAIQAREIAQSVLGKLAAPGDTLRIASLEMKPWRMSPVITLPKDATGLAEVADSFPVSPASGSLGGIDIYGGLLALAVQGGVNPVVLVISKDASQLPADGKGRLLTEDAPSLQAALKKYGFRAPQRHTVALESGRHLMLTVLIPEHFATGAARSPYNVTPAPQASGQTNAAPLTHSNSLRGISPTPAPSESTFVLLLPLIGVVGVVVGVVLGFRLRRPTPATLTETAPPTPISEPAPTEPTPAPTPAAAISEDAGLAEWKAEAKRLQRTLDGIAQELGESAEVLTTSLKSMGGQLQDRNAIRQEVLSKELEISAWDDSAIDFLDAVHRAMTLPGLAPERKETWEKAARDFIRLIQRNGLDVIDPKEGEAILPGLHQIDRTVGEGDRILRCLSWGYRRGGNVIRPASVEVGETTTAR